jgi:hypothetical protein
MRVRTQCRECGLPFRAVLTPETSELSCPNCQAVRPVAKTGWTDVDAPDGARVDVCPLCGCRHLYGQKDVNRAAGCAIVALGAALVPWTFGLSLIACGLIDLWFYRRLQEVPVCYKCDTVYRDAKPGPRQGEFELLKHDVLKYGKAWEPKQGPSAEKQAGEPEA